MFLLINSQFIILQNMPHPCCYLCQQPVLQNPLRHIEVYCLPPVGKILTHSHYHPDFSFVCLQCKITIDEKEQPLPLIQCGDCESTFYDTFYEIGHLPPTISTCGGCKKPMCKMCFQSRHLGLDPPHRARIRDRSPIRMKKVNCV
jgi:hypothetical protein